MRKAKKMLEKAIIFEIVVIFKSNRKKQEKPFRISTNYAILKNSTLKRFITEKIAIDIVFLAKENTFFFTNTKQPTVRFPHFFKKNQAFLPPCGAPSATDVPPRRWPCSGP